MLLAKESKYGLKVELGHGPYPLSYCFHNQFKAHGLGVEGVEGKKIFFYTFKIMTY